MVILGVSAFFHDSAAAIVQDGRVIAAAQEERFSRVKNDAAFPIRAIEFCLEQAGYTLDELDALVFYDKPLLKLERILESYHSDAPAGLRSFLTSMPVWMKQKMMLKKIIRDELYAWQRFDKRRLKLLFTEHHLAHAASAYYPSPFDEAAVLTIDGVGEWATTSIGIGRGREIELLREIKFPHSLGLLYSAFTYYCGFEVNSGEYKLMGLAPYGDETSQQYLEFREKITDKLVTIYDDGSFVLHQEYFDYITGLRMTANRKWAALFGFPRRRPEAPLEQQHCNLALAIQRVTEEIVLKLAVTAREITGMRRLCLAGGVALNCVANGKLLDTGIFDEIWVQPAAGDAGGALGAALAGYHIYFEGGRKSDKRPSQRGAYGPTDGLADSDEGGGALSDARDVTGSRPDGMSNAYLGPEFSIEAIRRVCRAQKAEYTELGVDEELVEMVARELAAGKIVGWFQGRMEFGPRALGHRSILANPKDPEMQKKLNLSIKNREGFRPFAPVIRAEEAERYLERPVYTPYMLLTRRLAGGFYLPLQQGYTQLPMREKLAVVRSRFPAITHVDGSCRVQTVRREANERLWRLLKAFEGLTGDGMLINTSFNVRDEPIVCGPAEAYACFRNTEMDVLVMENIIIFK